jgi:predicted nuclease of predicted toxin-antitoxin system
VKGLFIELYLDEDVTVLLASLLQAHGFDVETARGANQLGRTDEEQLAFAAEKNRAIVTHNRADFEALAQAYYEAGRTYYGIIIVVRRSPYESLRRLLVILDEITAIEMQNQLVYI